MSSALRLQTGEPGGSALEQAALFEPLIDSTERQVASLLDALRALRSSQRHYRVGAGGERRAASRVQQVLVDLGSSDWHLLADRRWPGTRRANIDLLLVGPPGVIVLDAKTWAQPRIDAGSLWRGVERADEQVDAVLRMSQAVAASLADVGLAPVAVHPVILLVGRDTPAVQLRGVTVVGELALQRELVRMGPRLHAEQIATLVDVLERRCPPAAGTNSESATRRTLSSPADPAPAAGNHTARGDDALFAAEDVWAAAVEAAMREPIEAWMTWLHPAQAQLVTRRYSGPARVRGATGTGKTVVALHRARHLARRPGARVLVTSFVRTLPAVQRSLFARLAPDLTGRVEFLGLHAWAMRLLLSRGTAVSLADHGGRPVFDLVWREWGQTGPLGASSLGSSYWWEEVQYVIKGRGLTRREDYLALDRVGRRTPLREEQRNAVWELSREYDGQLRRTGHHDFADLLLLACDSVRRDPVDPAYTAVIVDEVQDLSCVGLRLVHALVGDGPDGLLVVGDGQQAVYPGGFTLAEAGVSVTGRATVLDRNYRNAARILRAAMDVVDGDAFDDLETGPLPGRRDVVADRGGGRVLRVQARGAASQRAAVVDALRWAARTGVRLGDMAVLVPDNRRTGEWADALTGVGLPVVFLREYDGAPVEAVKVGTYQRAKGLEFACVFLPDHDRAVAPRRADETEDAYRERAELQRRQLFAAMTRARDRLWLGGS